MDKGATSSETNYKSKNGRWFNKNQTKPYNEEVTDGIEDLYNNSNSLMYVRCKRGSAETVECYQVLALFTKYYNNWFVSIEDTFAWVNNASKKSNVKLLVKLMTRTGGAFLYVQLDKDIDWGPHNIFCTVNFDDITKVENELIEM